VRGTLNRRDTPGGHSNLQTSIGRIPPVACGDSLQQELFKSARRKRFVSFVITGKDYRNRTNLPGTCFDSRHKTATRNRGPRSILNRYRQCRSICSVLSYLSEANNRPSGRSRLRIRYQPLNFKESQTHMDKPVLYEVTISIEQQTRQGEAAQGALEKADGEIVVPSTAAWSEGVGLSKEGSWTGY
jgi:hypothetical protein